MATRKSLAFLAVGLTMLVAGPLVAVQGGQKSGSSAGTKPASGAVERGKYIVEDVAMCGQCHTPRLNDTISADRWRPLQGGPLWFEPARPVADWPLVVPRIAGTVPGTDADVVTLLTTGIWKDGKPLRPPMPQFRMSREDAAAVVAYLKSLGER